MEAHTTATKSAIFTGSPEAEERAKAFAGPGDVVYEERQRKLDSDTETLVQSEQNDAAKGKPDAKEKR